MSHGGMVIGLGGSGVRVTLRVRQVLASSGEARIPDSIRLLAFDIRKPLPATGRLPQSYSFQVLLPPPDEAAPGQTPRQAARGVLLDDLAQGAASSLTLRGLAAQLDGLRRARVDDADVFLVCSSFGDTGTAWLLDMAYLVRHLTQKRIQTRIHAVALAPEGYERAFFPTQAQRMTSFAFLRELEALQCERSWDKGFSIYGGKYIGSLPGQLNARPFDTVQIVDAQDLNTSPEAGAIPAAADGILCQLDSQVAEALAELKPTANPAGAHVFSAFGMFSLVYPTRLMLEQAVQRLLIGFIDQLVPLEKNPDTGRPIRVAEPSHLRPDDPYGKLEAWIPTPERSGVLEDVLHAGAASQQRDAFRAELARRTPAEWKALLYRCVGSEPPTADPNTQPETYLPLVQAHLHQFVQALGERLTRPDPRLGAPLEYLQKLEQAAAAYLQDLDATVETWRARGEHSENPELRRAVNDSRRELEQKRGSLIGRLIPQSAQDAQSRYSQARQQYQQYRQREAVAAACLQTAGMLRALSHRLLQFAQRAVDALALQPNSVYNQALDQSQRLEREARFETAVRSQQLVVDQGYESSQSSMVFKEFVREFNETLLASLAAAEKNLDWESPDQHLPFQLADPNLGGEAVDLDDPDLQPDSFAALLTRALSMRLAEALLRVQPDNTVINFLSYLDPRADRLASRLASSSAPLARLVTPTPARRNFLFSPRPNSPAGSTYTQDLLAELHHHLGEVYVYQREDADRLALFRYFDGIGLDNLLTFHQSEPSNLDPAELKNFILWSL
ncbi:MAG TPA: tubulin-like doman-containing protein [Anaerolinea sp.]|nr:tubulin-like doman-containing protein [Anaerolinea sp.]